jgi:hypothetical protein
MSTAADIEYINDALDFNLTCEVTRRDEQGQKTKCGKPAAWLGIPPCGCSGYFCANCQTKTTPFNCDRCGTKGMLLKTYEWIAL